jgi:translation initiation factor IF-2
VFKVGRKGQIAGCYVRDGTVTRSDHARVMRGGQVVAEGRIESLRRFQEDVREVQSGYECGIKVEGVDEFQEGDVLEFFRMEQAT